MGGRISGVGFVKSGRPRRERKFVPTDLIWISAASLFLCVLFSASICNCSPLGNGNEIGWQEMRTDRGGTGGGGDGERERIFLPLFQPQPQPPQIKSSSNLGSISVQSQSPPNRQLRFFNDYNNNNNVAENTYGDNDFERGRRNSGPSLSIVNPLDVLRQRLLLEIGRRRLHSQSQQINANTEFLKTIGKRRRR